MIGSDGSDPLLLQAKEAQESVLAQFVGASQYSNQGERVVAGQHLMQASSDIFLGWDQVEGLDGFQRDFYIRQLRDWKGSVDTEVMVPQGMAIYGRLCGWTLAGLMLGRATGSPSPPIWDRAIPSTTPSPPLPRRMRTRTSVITTPSRRRPPKGALWSRPVYDRSHPDHRDQRCRSGVAGGSSKWPGCLSSVSTSLVGGST